MKRRCLVVEVAGWPRADGGRSSSDGHWDKCLLAKAKHTELVGIEVQASKEEVWNSLKTGGTHIPIGGSVGNSSEPII